MGSKTGHFKTFLNYCVLIVLLFNEAQSQKIFEPGCCPRSGPFSCYGVGSCDLFCCNCINGCQPGAVVYDCLPLFNQLDKNKDNVLKLPEIIEYLKEVLYITEYDINCSSFGGYDLNSLFHTADENNNNQLEREEFQNLKDRVPILSAIIDGYESSSSTSTGNGTGTCVNNTHSSTPRQSSNTFFELVGGKLWKTVSNIPTSVLGKVNPYYVSSNDRKSPNSRRPKMTIKIVKSAFAIKSKVNNVNDDSDDDELVNIVLNEFDTDFITVYSSVNTTLGDSNSNYPGNLMLETENLTASQASSGNTTTFEFSTAKNQMYHVGVACAADYQLKWTSNIPNKSQLSKKTFFSFENYDENFLNPENDTNAITFELWISAGLSGVLSCESVTNSTLSTRIYIYGQGTTQFVSCPSKTNKNQEERLLQSARNWFLRQDQLNLYDYIPIGLFYLSIKTIILDNHQNINGSNPGHFFVPCQSNFPNLTYKNVGKELRLIEHRDFQRKQVVKQIFRVLGNQTREVCDDISSNSSSVLLYDPTKGFLVPNHAKHPAWYTCEYSTSDSNTTESQNFISYLKEDSDTGRKLITGNYKFNSDNTFDYSTWVPTGISCIDPNGSTVVIVMKPCTSPFACDLQDFCTGDEDFESSPQVSFRSIEKPYNHGVVFCINIPNLREIPTKDYTFIGLDKIRYWVSGHIPDRALINIQETEPVLHTNKLVDFSCEVSTFLLRSSNITFMVTMNVSKTENSTRNIQTDPHLLNVTLEASNLKVMYNKHQEFADLGFGLLQISVLLRTDIVAIICSAEWYNQTTVLSTSRKFEARDVAEPNIQRDPNTAPNAPVVSSINVKNFILFKNKKGQSIPCSASGEPSPTVWWDSKTEQIGAVYPGNTTGVSLLTFQSFDDSVQGRYTCHAHNEYGDDLYHFDVSVQDPSLISDWEITGIAVGSLALLIISICLIGLIRKYRQVKNALRNLTDEEVKEFTEGKAGPSSTSGGQTDISVLPFNPDFILPPSHLMIEKSAILGQGQFGIVYRGLLDGNAVAVKTTNPDADILYVKSLLAELKIMGHIGKHPNVVEFLGAVTDQIRERKIQAVVELSPIGSLESYLTRIRTGRDSLEFVNLLSSDGSEIVYSVEKQGSLLSPYIQSVGEKNEEVKITTIHLIEWCKQIAAGMEFLASKNVVHADLATRNVLVFHDNVVKVSDFGLSKQLYSCATYVKKQKTMLPWRWMALETLLHMEFSIKSDVWSYGVTVWEILSMGQVPYPGLINWSNEFVNILSGGMRMAKPAFSTKTVYDQMVQCWDVQPEQRPTFTELVNFFEKILQPFSLSQKHLHCDEGNGEAPCFNEIFINKAW